MYYIKKSEWEKIPNDYKGESINNKGVKVVFEGSIPRNNGKGGTTHKGDGQARYQGAFRFECCRRSQF